MQVQYVWCRTAVGSWVAVLGGRHLARRHAAAAPNFWEDVQQTPQLFYAFDQAHLEEFIIDVADELPTRAPCRSSVPWETIIVRNLLQLGCEKYFVE